MNSQSNFQQGSWPQKPDYIVKCIVIGHKKTGKSNLLSRFCHNTYSGYNSQTIGIDFISKTIKMSEKLINLVFWDIEANPKMQSDQLFQLYCKGTILIVVVYAINDSESFTYAQKLLNSIQKMGSTAAILLLANKVDLEDDRKVDRQVGQKLADQYLIHLNHRINQQSQSGFLQSKPKNREGLVLFEEISVKQMINMDKVFNELKTYIFKTIKSY